MGAYESDDIETEQKPVALGSYLGVERWPWLRERKQASRLPEKCETEAFVTNMLRQNLRRNSWCYGPV